MEPDLTTTPINLDLAVQYGNCVEAAYTVYNNDPTNVNPPVTAYPSFIQAGYRLMFNIQMTDFDPFNKTPSYYGFIAQSLAAPYNYVVAIRGTLTWEEWYDDFDFFQTPFNSAPNGGKVARGFYKLFESLLLNDPATGTTTMKLMDTAVKPSLIFDNPGKTPVVIAGHSLGAALTTMYAAYMAAAGPNGENLSVYTFASPKVGDVTFADTYNNLVPANYRIYNKPDLVPDLPVGGFEQVGGGYEIDSKDYPEIRRSLLCYHSLLTDLYILSNKTVALSSSCVKS